jgi:hypothetical protein
MPKPNPLKTEIVVLEADLIAVVFNGEQIKASIVIDREGAHNLARALEGAATEACKKFLEPAKNGHLKLAN